MTNIGDGEGEEDGFAQNEDLAKRLAKVQLHTIYEVVHGSHAYGMATPTSDFDMKGVAILPELGYYLGHQRFDQQDGGWPCDKVVYHLPKFTKMAALCNPNIIEVLWVDESDIRVMTQAGKRLRDNRDLFLSKKARFSFYGYALSQLKRIEAYKRWLDYPPVKPDREQFTHTKVIDIGPLGTEFSENLKVLEVDHFWETAKGDKWVALNVQRFDRGGYESAKKDWENFTRWRAERNPKRAALEAMHGIDTKHAAHLVRLCRMGYEMVAEGRVVVKRPDAQELLDIRNGAWSYDKILAYAEEMKAKLTEAYEKSPLPEQPNWAAIEQLQIDLISEALHEAGVRI